MVKVLHIINDYSQSIYSNLTDSLRSQCDQTVFIYNRSYSITNHKFSLPVHQLLVNRIMYLFYRVLLPVKNALIYKALLKLLNKENYNIIHSHTWFSGGGAARLLKQKKNINYIITIRNADIYYIWKYFPWYRKYGIKILLDSSKIICLSSIQKKKILRLLKSKQLEQIQNKIIIIPNGIDSFWFEDMPKPKSISSKVISLLFVGEISYNKNIHSLFRLLKLLNNNSYSYKLIIIGGHKRKLKNKLYMNILKLYINIFSLPAELIGEVNNKDNLKKYYYNSDIYIMISKKETFGLTYIESMSQGTPIVYTKGQGIDGWFSNGKVGYDVLPNDLNTLQKNLTGIKDQYKTLSSNCIKESKQFNWNLISTILYENYTEVVNNEYNE